MKFRLVIYNTTQNEKYEADSENRFEIFGDKKSIWYMWHFLTDKNESKRIKNTLRYIIYKALNASHKKDFLVCMSIIYRKI